MSETDVWDALIVGGGPAGLSAAIWLARYHRSVLVLDSGEPRNQPTWAVHGFPGLPEVPPLTLRRRLRDQAEAAGARVRAALASECHGRKDGFDLRLADGPVLRARRVLFAFGRQDVVPEIEGMEAAFGISVFHCPDCDGPTVRGRSVAVLGSDAEAVALALFLTPWASRLTLIAAESPAPQLRARLDRAGVETRSGSVKRLRSTDGLLESIDLDDGAALPADALFFHLGTYPACELAQALGCDCDTGGHVSVDHGQETSVPGIYAAGDLTGHPYLAIAAAADGVRAALSIHRSLLPAELELG
ncbi:MAG: NAD(P)/FAD-dependent oxidoreductase [Longimicrobiales bacterium]